MTPQNDQPPCILVVDDDKTTRDGLERALRREYRATSVESGTAALRHMETHHVDVLLADLRMPGMDGLTLLQRALAHNSHLICILLTAYGTVETAVEAMKRGAYDFLMKPVNLDHLDLLLRRALRSRDIESENRSLREQLDNKFGMENIVGNSPAMQRVFEIIRQAAPTDATLLIEGESGTGKELVAHAIHRLSTRNHGPFVAVHCAALSANLLESELFGHEKGAFTGALSRRQGRFELADGGTMFLDEVSEIDPAIQVKLLRVIEERCFERVGGNETIQVDIRLITATNRKLKELVQAGKFREDLYFRLAVVDLQLPPLRERQTDIPLLCNHYLNEFKQRSTRNIDGFTPETLHALASYTWPGNVRELRNTIEKMVVLSRGGKLGLRDVPTNLRDGTPDTPATSQRVNIPSGSRHLSDMERAAIFAAIQRNNDNRTKAAKELGISRRTLHRKLREYQIEDSDSPAATGSGANTESKPNRTTQLQTAE